MRERAFVFVEGDRIREVSDRPFAGSDAPVLDLGGRFVMPGLIDAHFHAYGRTSIRRPSTGRRPPFAPCTPAASWRTP